jgi:hypothetical protein
MDANALYIHARVMNDSSVLKYILFASVKINSGRLCALVVRVPGYRSRGPGSIPVATGFSEQ